MHTLVWVELLVSDLRCKDWSNLIQCSLFWQTPLLSPKINSNINTKISGIQAHIHLSKKKQAKSIKTGKKLSLPSNFSRDIVAIKPHQLSSFSVLHVRQWTHGSILRTERMEGTLMCRSTRPLYRGGWPTPSIVVPLRLKQLLNILFRDC